MNIAQLGQSGQTFYDVDGTEKITDLLTELLNSYPGLADGHIKYGELTETGGLAFFSSTGAVLVRDQKDITGHTYQVCQYPFEIVYRVSSSSEEQKVRIKEFLDGIGRWLERQPVKIWDTVYQLEEYPEIKSGNRVITEIYRSTPGHLQNVYQDIVEDWTISMSLQYENYF